MREKKYGFLLALVLLHGFWFVAGLYWQHYYNGDAHEYIYLAENLKKGYYYGANPALGVSVYNLSVRPPVYSLCIYTIYNLFGYNIWILLLVQNVLSIASCHMIYSLFRKWCPPGRKYTVLMTLFVITYPAQMFFANTVTPDTLLQFFLMLYVYRLLRRLTEPRPSDMALMGLWLLLATLTKPIVYPYLLLHLAWAIWMGLRRRSVWLPALGALPVIAMMGYGLWNQQRTGLFHISSIQSINLLDYNAKLFQREHYGVPYADSVNKNVHQVIDTMQALKPKYEYASRKASEMIRQDLWAYALFHGRESLRFFIEPGKADLDLFVGTLTYHKLVGTVNFWSSYQEQGLAGAWRYLLRFPTTPVVLLVFLFNLLRLAGAAMFVFSRKIPLTWRIACCIYIGYFAAITGPVANTRYYLPVLPVLSAMAMIGFGQWIMRRKQRKSSPQP